MKLRDLEARFVGEVSQDGKYFRYLDSVEGAQGIMFLCPKCFKANGGRVGTHMVLCWFANPRNAPKVPDNMDPKPGRWNFQGETIDELTFVGPGAFSVLLTSGCNWHGFVKNGDAT